jgi:rod shape-determining protein MreD
MASGILTFSQKIDILLRFCTAYALIICFWAMDVVSFQIPYFQDIRPSFTLMALFYWSIYRPTLLPPWMAFLLGILIDLLSGLPIGLTAVLFVLAQRVVVDQRKIFSGQSFLSVYFGYTVIAAAVYILQWFLYGFVILQWVSFQPVLGMIILGVVFFPLALLLMNLTHRMLPSEFSGGKQAVPPLRSKKKHHKKHHKKHKATIN